MRLVLSLAAFGLAAAFALAAAAADDATKNRAGANASIEGGVALGGTGVNTKAADRQVRRDNKEEKAPVKPKRPAQRKDERDASAGTTGRAY